MAEENGMKRKLFGIVGVLAVSLALGLALTGCTDSDDGGSGGGGDPLAGTWSQPDNTAIRFTGGNLQSTQDITNTNPNWTLQGTYIYSSPTLTIQPPPQNGVVQNAVQMTAIVSGIQLTISGAPNIVNVLNGSWTKQ
jgi:hypothetical protein